MYYYYNIPWECHWISNFNYFSNAILHMCNNPNYSKKLYWFKFPKILRQSSNKALFTFERVKKLGLVNSFVADSCWSLSWDIVKMRLKNKVCCDKILDYFLKILSLKKGARLVLPPQRQRSRMSMRVKDLKRDTQNNK